jgi:F-type H+-transporting ATPase subunit epsilon
MKLTLATADRVLLDGTDILALRAEDETGSFGILPGHADFVTALVPTVLTWRTPDGTEHHCAVRSGVLVVTGGHAVGIAVREAVPGPDLDALEAVVRDRLRQAEATERAAAAQAEGLHLEAIRRMAALLRPAPPSRPPLP